jgi:hypothetical protein
MNDEELKRFIEFCQNELPEQEFFKLIIEKLNGNLSDESRDFLRGKLLAYFSVDEDAAAKYWGECLANPDPIQREFAALQLATMARWPNSRALQILTEYLGDKPTENGAIEMVIERFSKLFPWERE